MITRKTFVGLTAAVIAASSLGAFGLASQQSGGAQRADCPGKINCPLTGELVCKDRCPLGEQAASEQSAELPACCRTRTPRSTQGNRPS